MKNLEFISPKLKIQQEFGNLNCSINQWSDVCLACKEGFSLFNKVCKGYAQSNAKTATYYYKNPSKNAPNRLSLNLNFDKIMNAPYFTLFFFIKIYGFVKNIPEQGPVKLIIFHQEQTQDGKFEDEFYLAYHPYENQKLFFYVNGQMMFSVSEFRDYFFGIWVPISFAAFREEDRLFKMNMVQASINYYNTRLDSNYILMNEIFPYVKFTQFTITNNWVGLLSDIKIYNKFIINAWGIIQKQYESKNNLGDPIEEISLKSDSSNNCLLSNQILNKPSSGFKIQCIADYNPHFSKNCTNFDLEVTSFSQVSNCLPCCKNNAYSITCIYGHNDISCGTRSENYSCETQTPKWKTFFPFYSESDRRIDCQRLSFIDYNRYKYARSNDVESPQDVWAIDFWFRTATNLAARKRGQMYFLSRNENNNNFNEFIIEWNYHTRIRVYKELKSEIDISFTYIVECNPLIVVGYPELSTSEIYTKNLGDVHYSWTYISCGANFAEKNFYLTDNNKFLEEKTFTSEIQLIPTARTSLTITENSRPGYGFTFIYQLRLWHCYDCAPSYKNLEYKYDNPTFNAVYHDFHGSIETYDLYQPFEDKAKNAETTYMYQVADYPGYTLNFNPDKPTLCDEEIYEYYNEKNAQCERHFNAARMAGEKKLSIPSSRNGRYTMDFWFYVENSAELSPGFNLFWENHLSISLLRDTSNRNTINAFCFPQSYIDNIDGKRGQDIIEMYDMALNKDKYLFYQSSSMWNFVRCAVDQTRKRFYINDNLLLDLEGEILYGTTRNYRPFRFFNIAAYHNFKIQNTGSNPTRIFLRQIKCYREYIDFRLMELKYKACGTKYDGNNGDGHWINPCNFYPLSLCFDYGELLDPLWQSCDGTRKCFTCPTTNVNCGLIFHIFDETDDNIIKVTKHYWRELLVDDLNVYYPTFPDIYLPNFCEHGRSGGDKEPCGNEGISNCRLRNSTAFFWPDEDYKYIDLDTLEKISTCRSSCRPPDSYYKRNFCLLKQNTLNMFSCANSYAIKDDYFNQYLCQEGYTKVYYECIESHLLEKSALYFSNIYSFSNTVFDPDIKSIENSDYQNWKIEKRVPSYYLEVWMKFDAINYKKEMTEVEYYLYAHPHIIIKDPEDKMYKYSNKILSSGNDYYVLTSIHNYEWNHIIIQNLYDRKTKIFTINFYLNNNFDNPLITIPNLPSSKYKLHFRGFGFCNRVDDTYCSINDDIVYIKWGVAWYRNFRIWDADITSLQVIQACEYGYTQLLNSQKYYFSLTVDSLEKNTIKDRIDPENNRMKLNFWTFTSNYEEAFDNDMRINFSLYNFDKTYMNENYFITGINSEGTDYSISECPPECKRCYSSNSNECYECRIGYSLYGSQCKANTGYFFKTPPNNPDIEKIEISTKNDNNFIELHKINPLTITLYIKYFGIDLKKVNSDKVLYKLACFYKDINNNDECLTYIGYNYDDRTIILVVDGDEIYNSEVVEYIGIWTHFGISVYRKEDDNNYFPNMLNFMIDQKELIPKLGFNPTLNPVKINTFTIYTEAVCYYSSFRVFSTFYYGPYGHINGRLQVRRSKLLYFLDLYGSSNKNCLTNQNLEQYPDVDTNSLETICIADYQPYEDNNNICTDDSHFMDIMYKLTPPCELCDAQCITNCFNLESNECTCDFYEGLYWIKSDNDYQSYECERVDSINFAFFESVTLYELSVVTNDEMTMVFWLNIYEYLDNTFESLEIIWNQHLAVIIKGNGQQGDDKFLNIECHGDYDINDPYLTHTIVDDIGNIKYRQWNYIICKADKFRKLIKVNNCDEKEYTPVTYSQKLSLTSLTIVDKTINFNYGFSFVRELKLFSAYIFDFWDDSIFNLKKTSFNYLLHHFHNDFNEDKLSDTRIKDQIEGLLIKLNAKPNRIGYNYVIDYEKLFFCEEGYVYNNMTNSCLIFNTQNCRVPRDSEDNCLLCFPNKPYLKDTDECVDDCRPYYFADEYLKQCKKCHSTCYTCSGKRYDNCLSCTGDYFLIESLHICVPNCQEYGLIISTSVDNKCEELIIETYISIPVYLNYSYDYNPLNEDYHSKIVSRDSFNEIKGHITQRSSVVNMKWTYNWEESLEINKPYRFFNFSEIPNQNPIISDPYDLTISLRNDYFKNGYKYIFNLEIISTSGNFNISQVHRYIIMMNDFPELSAINILPNRGYISNKFLISILDCIDDISEKNSLTYKFSYFTKKADIQSGFNETSPKERIIQDWSRNAEVLFQFEELNPLEWNKFYIRGYCMDEFGLYYSIIQEIEVYDIPTKSKIDIPFEESISEIDIDGIESTEQLLNRAQFLSSLTGDFDKGLEVRNRTNITDFNNKGLWQQKLILSDPTSSIRDIYCNYRGDSYVEYFYLICDCHGYDGNMCQIDHNSYEYMIDLYNKMLNKIKIMQTRKYDRNLINSIYLLVKSAASFMEIDNINYFFDSLNIIDSYMNQFASEMLKGNNYEVYFDIYNSFIEYGISIVNKLKYKNFISLNKRNAENLYNEEKMRNATLSKKDAGTVRDYFSKMKSSIQNLLDFFAYNKKEFRFINKNINAYVIFVNEEFSFDNYFNIEKKIYEPYIDFKNCIEKNLNLNIKDPSYRLYISIIVWKISPYMYNEELYWDTLTPAISFKFINFETGDKIYLINCQKDDNEMKLYFPVNNYHLVNIINEKRELLSPENQFDLNAGMFADPIYINKSGAVINTTPQERREKYFLGFNFSCKYYFSSIEDRNNIQLSTAYLDYNKYTKDNYIQCLLTRSMEESYNEFIVDFYSISSNFHINSRLFYIKHYELFKWKDNYKENYAFYYHLIIIMTYFILSISYFYFEKYNYIKKQTKAQLKGEIAKMNLPYIEEYVFENDLRLKDDIKSKLNKKPKPIIEEMNLDINNLNVGIMAEEISKYKKGFQRKENVNDIFKYNKKFFNTKEPENKNKTSNFFSKDEDIINNINIDNEISQAQLAKTKKFYQVGFKGLDSKENIKQEIALSSDKTRIIIKKNKKLDLIKEIKEEEEIEISDKGLDFFDKESEDTQEKKTALKKKINKKKISKNLTQYQSFISSNADIDSKSKLRDSNRETSTKKYFNSNPPKKPKKENSIQFTFTEKDQKKIGKSNSKFFSEGTEGLINNKRKEKNIFQKEYQTSYKPKFNGPKIIGENLGFYTYETDFEQNFDSQIKNAPYFGEKFREKKSEKKERITESDTPKMTKGFYFKRAQIDLKDTGKKLPPLPNNLTLEQKILEFHDIPTTFKGFLIRNITSRYILLTTFSKMNIAYQRYMRAGNFAAQLSLYAFFLSILFALDENMLAYEKGGKEQISKFIYYCFLSDVFSSVLVHLPAYCFWLSDKKLRKLYNIIRLEEGMEVVRKIENVIKKGRIFWIILGILIQLIYIFFGFYFSFGFCATYYKQRNTFCLALFVTCGLDFLFIEFIWEIFISILFYISDFGIIPSFFGMLFNQLRYIKHLV